MKLHTIALGCQMSAADAAEMSEPIYQRGFHAARSPEEADAILISTCTVRQHAEDRALSLIGSLRSWKERDPRRVLIVAGCAAERLKGWIRLRFPHVDLVVGARSISEFPEIVEEALGERFDALREDAEAFPETPGPLRPSGNALDSRVAAFVTIMRGCNYSCSYCIVPAVRGREIYRPVEDILQEVRRKTEAGVKEITLLGQTVNSYDGVYKGQPARFADLLRLIDRIPGLARLRFMSPHPHYLDERMIAAMAECPSVCDLLHLPVQSGSDRILRLMRRNYTRQSYLRKVASARGRIPGIVFSTDIIVGFPSESEEDFRATLSLLEELGPVSAYSFKYSARETAPSASWPDDVPRGAKEERLARLNELVGRMTQNALRSQIGKTVEVLNEEAGFGRTREGFAVKWKTKAKAGEMTPVAVTGATRRTLLGECHEC